jgi:carboxyl-terminal processing protease
MTGKAADNAFIITRMVAKYHVQPRTIDQVYSEDLYGSLISRLDPDKIYFSRDDISQLSRWKNSLDDQLLKRKSDFLKLIVSIYRDRVLQNDSLVDLIGRSAFHFDIPETFTAKEDTSYVTTMADRRLKLYKILKWDVMEELLPYYESRNGKSISSARTDSLEKSARTKILRGFKREIQRIRQFPGGTEGFVCDAYCSSVATCFDPHTEYFSLQEKENFQGELGAKPMQFGFSLTQGKEGVEIAKLKPGSPAYRCGQMNVGDRILSLQWEDMEVVDVSDASTEEVNEMLSGENQKKLTLTLKKNDGSVRKIILQKEKAVLDDDLGKVKSFLLKGKRTVGFISLPAFYSEWENGRPDGVGCADDVGKEIIKLKKEGMDALILDLRYNGGGSVPEAIALTGIFIDAGPVAMVKDQDQKLYTLKDMNRGTLYDGPLLIIVNGFSASASEMFAAALQDYNRALIIGSPTYGKATAQVILPLDTAAGLQSGNHSSPSDGFLKITISKLYRINGTTAQENGVQPDIRIHDLTEVEPEREKTSAFTIHAAAVDPNRYYQPYHPLPGEEMRRFARSFTDSSRYFMALKDYIDYRNKPKSPKDVSLQMEDQMKLEEEGAFAQEQARDLRSGLRAPYEVQWHGYENERMKTDENLRFDNALWKEVLLSDPEIVLSYLIASRMAGN